MFRRPPWLTYIFAAITLLTWLGGRFLTFLWPGASEWLTPVGVVCAIIAMLWLFVCVFQSKPRSAPILLATLVIIQAVGMIEAQSSGGLIGFGFRIHASPVEQYLATCRMFDFTDGGEKHIIGACESQPYEPGFPPGLAYLAVIYDPTGNLLKPESERSPEWTRAFDKIRENDVAILRFQGARRLSKDFYLADLSY